MLLAGLRANPLGQFANGTNPLLRPEIGVHPMQKIPAMFAVFNRVSPILLGTSPHPQTVFWQLRAIKIGI
jgi:hypothetical protein